MSSKKQEKQRPDYVRHNHLTRDIKPKGVCPSCDLIHEKIR